MRLVKTFLGLSSYVRNEYKYLYNLCVHSKNLAFLRPGLFNTDIMLLVFQIKDKWQNDEV